MSIEVLKKEGGPEGGEGDMHDSRYMVLGGIINEKDYVNALRRAETGTGPDQSKVDKLGPDHNKQTRINQVIGIVDTINRILKEKNEEGIVLRNIDGKLDPKVKLYLVLRGDQNTETGFHHSAMSDQRLFAEVLRMLEDEDSLKKLIKTHPNISFS